MKAALAAAQVQHREQQAMTRLNDANVILIQMAEEYPQTRAAQIARQMLECGEVQRRAGGEFEDFGDKPVPTRRTPNQPGL